MSNAFDTRETVQIAEDVNDFIGAYLDTTTAANTALRSLCRRTISLMAVFSS